MESPDARLTRLEEHAAFSERTIEQLSEEIAAMNTRMRAIAAQVERLEKRLVTMAEPAPESAPQDEE